MVNSGFFNSFKTIFVLSLVLAFLLGSLISTIFIIGYPSVSAKTFRDNMKIRAEYSECNNLELEDTAYCLRDWMSGFYNYTLRPDYYKTLEDVQTNGGDCFDYSLIYVNAAKNLGFSAYQYTMHYDNLGHAIAVIMNDKGYCLLDQVQIIQCVNVLPSNLKEEDKGGEVSGAFVKHFTIQATDSFSSPPSHLSQVQHG